MHSAAPRTESPTVPWPPSSRRASDGAIKVRWFRTHGEQFHSKLVAMRTRHRILVHARLGQSHAPQPRRFQSRGQHRRECAAQRRDRDADQRLVRVAVDQSRAAGARVHRGVRRVRRSLAGHATGSTASWKRPVYLPSETPGSRAAASVAARASSVMAAAVAASKAADHRIESVFALPRPILAR